MRLTLKLAVLAAASGLLVLSGQSTSQPSEQSASAKSQDDTPEKEKKAAAKQVPEAPVPVRPANRELFTDAAKLMEKVRVTVEKLAKRAEKPDELADDSEAIKKEIAGAYKTLREINRLGDELTLRGELDGLGIQVVSRFLQPPLDLVVTQIRPHLEDPDGLLKAATGRAKDQTGPLGQLDDCIKQKQWNEAYEKLQELFDKADEVGLFVDAKPAGELYVPILERAAKVAPQYLAERKKELTTQLREEYAAVRPDFTPLRRKITAALGNLRDRKEIQWDDKKLKGPECVLAAAADWQEMDGKVAQALAVLHAIGPEAALDINALVADYEAARTRVISTIPDLIRGESAFISGTDVEAHYVGYVATVPVLLSAVRGSAPEFQDADAAMNELAARSPVLVGQVDRYREATTELIRWRRRFAQRYLKSTRALYAQAQPINGLLDRPPPLADQARTPRVNQTALFPQQTPEFVGAVWTEHWRGLPVTAQKPVVLWIPGAEPVFVSPWHSRACIESAFPRAGMDGLFQTLSLDLLSGPNRAPLTLEATLAVHTAAHGPYVEVGGVVTGVIVDSLPDRLWDLHHPLDVAGSLNGNALVAYPASAALVRLQVAPVWLAHDLFVWAAPPPPPPPAGAPPPALPPRAAAPPVPAAAAPAPAASAPPVAAPIPAAPAASPRKIGITTSPDGKS